MCQEQGNKMPRWTKLTRFSLLLCAALLRPWDAAAQLNSTSFSPPTWLGASAIYTYAFAVGDVDNDGFADIVLTNQRYNDPSDTRTAVEIFINDRHGAFHLASRFPTDGYGATAQSVKIADLDGDGRSDLIVLNGGQACDSLGHCQEARSFSVIRGNGDGTFQPAVSYLLNIYPNTPYPNTVVSPSKLVVADVNGDHKPDVIVAESVSYAPFAFAGNFRGGVSVLLNRGDGTFEAPVLYDSGGYITAIDVAAADVNGDGAPDIVVKNVCSVTTSLSPSFLCTDGNSARDPVMVGVLLNNGDGTFKQAISFPSGGYGGGAITIVDLDRDGNLDVLAANQCSNPFCNSGVSAGTASVLKGNGDGSFQPPINFNDGALQPVSIASADVDGDGLSDIAVMNYCTVGFSCDGSGGELSVLLGNGDGTLQVPALYAQGAVIPNTVILADLDNDGKPDAVIGTWTGFGVLLNRTPRATTTTTLFSSPDPAAYGQTVTFSATVSSSSPGTPSGTVTLRDGATTLGSTPLAGGVATFNISGLALGTHTVVANYSSDNAFRASESAPVTQLVKATTTTALASTASSSVAGQPVTFTATVTAQFGDAVTGTATFKDGSTTLGTAAISGSTADFATSSLSVGVHVVTAVYDGDAGHVGSTSAAFNQTITAVKTYSATALAEAAASGAFGGTTILTATLTSSGSPVAGALILFSLNATPVGSATTDGAGVAMLSAATLAGINAGTYPQGVQAAFAGDDTYAASTGTAALMVGKAAPVITWTAPAAIVHGTPLSDAQLNGTANIPGIFAYTPPAGTTLPVGADQMLSVIFTPADASNYATAQAQVAITVIGAAPVARSVVVNTQEGTARSGSLLASDADGVGVTFAIVTPPANGTLVLLDASTGAFTYTPNTGAFGYDPFTFRAAGPSGASTTATGMAFIIAAAPQWPGQTVRASVATGGTVGNRVSEQPVVSADGRYVAFYSEASNLVPGDTNNVGDVFVRDRQTGQTTRVSVAMGGVQGNAVSYAPAISADGRYVAFASSASNLVQGDTNGVDDVFIYDRQTGQTIRASVSSSGAEANGFSSTPAISADGRYVAFASGASNLAAGVTNATGDIFVRDLQAGQTIRASVSTDGSQTNGFSELPAISADGRYVAFESTASNLVSGDTNGTNDIFVRDLLAGQTTRISMSSDGTQANGWNQFPAISSDGRYVAFTSFASNLVPGDTNGAYDAFVVDRQTGQTTRVSVASDGSQANDASTHVSISADGRYVAFDSRASNLAPNDTTNFDEFVRDRQTGLTVQVSTIGVPGSGSSLEPALSADGRFIAFMSDAMNPTGFEAYDVFVAGGTAVSPKSVKAGAAGGNASVAVTLTYPDADSSWSATTTTPWITINAPNGGATSGTVSFTVGPNTGAARIGALSVALQTITVAQDAFVDVTPPTVTPPAPTTVFATVAAGATPATAPSLAAFLSGATAVDDGPSSPAAQPPTLNGIAITGTTVFTLGNNTVTFAFRDAAGNVGTATSVVTVVGGRPSLSIALVSVIVSGSGQQTVTLRLTNTGTGNALSVNAAPSSLRTLAGTGTVTIASGLPTNSPLLGPGQSLNLPILVNVPATVLRFALSLGLTTTDYTGALLSSVATQTIFPIDVTPPTVLNNGPTITPARLSVTVNWQTSEAATGAVRYQPGTGLPNFVPDDGVYATGHSVTITGLVPNTAYSVIVNGHDPAGNAYLSIVKTITTLP
jgi:hypothetical protein